MKEKFAAFVKATQAQGVDIYLSDHSTDAVVLDKLVVPKRKQGTGTRVMTELVKIADEEGTRLLLTVGDDWGATSTDRLRRFYGRFGFVNNRGRHKDFTITASMYRNPA